MSKKLDSLKKKIKELMAKQHTELKPLIDERNKIEEGERLKVLKTYVGRCFRFMNSRSGDEWLIHIRVIGVHKEFFNHVNVVSVEREPSGELSIEMKIWHIGMLKHRSSQKVFKSAFNQAVKQMRKRIGG